MLFAPDDDGHTGGDEHDAGERRALNAKADVVGKAVHGVRRVKLEHGVGHDKAAVRQAEEDILREIPRGVNSERAPEAVKIIHDEREQHTHGENIEAGQQRDAGV